MDFPGKEMRSPLCDVSTTTEKNDNDDTTATAALGPHGKRVLLGLDARPCFSFRGAAF